MDDPRKEMREAIDAAKVHLSNALMRAANVPEDEITVYLALRLEDAFMGVEFWLAKEHQFRNKVGEYA